MQDFTWDGGGEWQGRAWTADLPTDSAVLLYLVAAFLQTPRCALPTSGLAVLVSTSAGHSTAEISASRAVCGDVCACTC